MGEVEDDFVGEAAPRPGVSRWHVLFWCVSIPVVTGLSYVAWGNWRELMSPEIVSVMQQIVGVKPTAKPKLTPKPTSFFANVIDLDIVGEQTPLRADSFFYTIRSRPFVVNDTAIKSNITSETNEGVANAAINLVKNINAYIVGEIEPRAGQVNSTNKVVLQNEQGELTTIFEYATEKLIPENEMIPRERLISLEFSPDGSKLYILSTKKMWIYELEAKTISEYTDWSDKPEVHGAFSYRLKHFSPDGTKVIVWAGYWEGLGFYIFDIPSKTWTKLPQESGNGGGSIVEGWIDTDTILVFKNDNFSETEPTNMIQAVRVSDQKVLREKGFPGYISVSSLKDGKVFGVQNWSEKNGFYRNGFALTDSFSALVELNIEDFSIKESFKSITHWDHSDRDLTPPAVKAVSGITFSRDRSRMLIKMALSNDASQYKTNYQLFVLPFGGAEADLKPVTEEISNEYPALLY